MEKGPVTRKHLIVQRYTVLEKELKKHIVEDIFPSLDDIDIADLVYFITMLFLGITTEAQYEVKIREIIDANDIVVSKAVFELILPQIMDFVEWMKVL